MSWYARSIKGWAYDTAAPDSPVTLNLCIDGRHAATLTCDGYRKADPADEVPHANAGFKTAIPMAFWDGQRHGVSLVDAARDVVVVEQDLVMPRYLIAGAPVPLYGSLVEVAPHGVSGWVTDTQAPLHVELEVDGALVETGIADGTLPEKVLADFAAMDTAWGSFAFRLPAAAFDGADHVVAVAAVLDDGSRVQIRQQRITLPEAEEPVVSGFFEPLRQSRLEGHATRPDAPGESIEVSLLIDAVEIGSALTDPAAGGAFAFDLSAFTLPELLGAAFVVTVFPNGPAIPLRGEHPARDTLVMQFEAQDDGGIVARLEAGAPLSDRLAYRLTADEASLDEGFVGGVPDNPLQGIVGIDTANAGRPDLTFAIGDMAFPVRAQARGKSAETPVAVRSPRTLGTFVAPTDDRVRRHLGGLARSIVPAEADGDPDYSGVWRLTGDGVIEGWAVAIGGGGDALSIDLVVGGEVVASQAASHPVQPRESKVLFEVPVGFRFPLARLALAAGAHEISARVAGGHVLLPPQPRIYEKAETDRDERLIEAIDALVEEREPFRAFLLARAAPASVAGVKDRLALLDFATRGDWHDYPSALATRDATANGELLDHLDRLARRRNDESLEGLRTLAAELGLPPPYLAIVEGNVSPSAAAFAERLAFSVAIRDVPADASLSFDHGGLAIACLFGRDGLDDAMRDQLDALDRAGCHVSWHAPGSTDAIIPALEKTLPADCRMIMVLREPRLIGLAPAGLWPGLIGTGAPIATLATVSGEPLPPAERELAGRQFDLSTLISARTAAASADARPRAALECLTWRYYETSTAASAPTCVIVHGHGTEPPRTPAGARVIRVPEQENTLEAIWAAIAALEDALDPATPVIVQLPGFSYAPDHIEACLRAFTLAGNRSLATVAVRYDPADMHLVAADDAGISPFIGLLGFGCYRLADLVAARGRSREEAPSHLVPATGRPFGLVQDLAGGTPPELLVEIRRLFDELVTLRDRELAFEAFSRAAVARSGIAGAGQNHLSEKASKALLRLYPSPFPQEAITELIDLGRYAEAGDLLIGWVRNSRPLGGGGERELRGLLDSAKRLSLQRELADLLAPQIPQLGAAFSSLLIPLFEVLASVRSPADVGASLIACGHYLIADKSLRAIHRIVDLCRRYCSTHTMIVLLHLIDASPHSAVLAGDELGRAVGEALINGEPGDFTLPATGLSREHFLLRGPLTLQIVAALRAGERDAVVRLINVFLATRRDLKRLIAALRTYSWELSELAFAPGEILYPVSTKADERLAMAIVLGDLAAVQAFDDGNGRRTSSAEGSPGIVAATYFGDFEPLNIWFRRGAADNGVTPLRLGGDSIEDFYRRLTEQQVEVAAPAPGRVTALLTVYNPDLTLLDLSLASLLRQTHADLEVILIDDASDLVAADAIAAFAERDPRVRFLRMNRNSGPYVCRNRGLELATGDYVAIQDDDDFSHPQRFARQIAALAEGDMLKLCTTSHLRIDRGGRLQFEHTLGILGDGTMTSMFRRETFAALGPFAAVRSRGDVEYRERVKAAFGHHVYVHLPCPMVFCYATPGSLSNTTARTLPGYLALFRDNFAKRAQLPIVAAQGGERRMIAAEVPWPLRPA